jgi:hypothetical protein
MEKGEKVTQPTSMHLKTLSRINSLHVEKVIIYDITMNIKSFEIYKKKFNKLFVVHNNFKSQ